MDKSYNTTEISSIWSTEHSRQIIFNLWDKVSEWMSSNGFQEALREDDRIPLLPTDTQHELIDLLSEYINETGRVNAHAGLTSSDIIDNTRLIQLQESSIIIKRTLTNVVERLNAIRLLNKEAPCLGYTHWQPASRTTWGHRFSTWFEPLSHLSIRGGELLSTKRLGGAVGDRSAMSVLFGKSSVASIRDPFNSMWQYSLQSSYHLDELRIAQWFESIAAQVYKICQDIRFLCHTEELTIQKSKGYKGSSAMPGKMNPIEAEQICSLARLQPNFTRVIWDVMAFNGLERTLDTSASMRVTLPAMCQNIHYILTKFYDLLSHLRIDKERCEQVLKDNDKAATAEIRMATLIKQGLTRIEAYAKVQG